MAQREWAIGAQKVANGHSLCKVMVALTGFTVSVGVFEGVVHPLHIGEVSGPLDWLAIASVPPELTESSVVDSEVVGDLMKHCCPNLGSQPRVGQAEG